MLELLHHFLLFILITYSVAAVEECSAFEMRGNSQTCLSRQCQHALTPGKFFSPEGLFTQEHKSASLEKPGQHPNFGARLPWPQILGQLGPSQKLLYLIRHGEAVSNAVQGHVGRKWENISTQCTWKNESSGEELQLFDPPLTSKGRLQAEALLSLLLEGPVKLSDLTGKRRLQVIVSPLSRTLETYTLALSSLLNATMPFVDEFCRERFGHNTCDARRPVSLNAGQSELKMNSVQDPNSRQNHVIQCPVGEFLDKEFSEIQFRVTALESDIGLVAAQDVWWQDNIRESDRALELRAEKFMTRVFEQVEEQIVFVVSHSGMISAMLAAAGRQAYSAQNAELVPALIGFVR